MRKTPQDRSQIRDLLGGILLVPAITIATFILTFLIVLVMFSGWNTPLGLFYGTALFFLFFSGYFQVLYLLPFIIFFSNRRRSEVVKGMVISSVIFYFINANSCFTLASGDPTLVISLLTGYSIAIIVTLVLFLLNRER
jgi:hypothetical protein